MALLRETLHAIRPAIYGVGYNQCVTYNDWFRLLEVDMADEKDMHRVDSQVIGGELPDEEVLYDLADLFKVFADTTRIRILYALMDGGLFVNEIAEAVGISQSGVSHQLRTLKQAKLIRSTRDGKNVRYSLDDDHVITMLAQGLTHVTE